MAGGGAIVLWSGLTGHKWTTTLRSVVSGRAVPQAQELAIQSSPSAFSSGGSGSPGVGPLPPTGVGGTVAKNQAIARVLAARYGWSTGAQWSALVALWDRESGWSNTARNPTSGAYGIPQALPPSKMGVLANPPVSSATAQILWGLKYIHDRYGNPVNAEAHENANGWY